MQPCFTIKFDSFDKGRFPRALIHRRAVLQRINKSLHTDFGEHARPLRRTFAQHVKNNARRNVPRSNIFGENALPYERRLGIGWPRRIRAADNFCDHAFVCDVIDALGAEHITGSDRMNRCKIFWRAFGQKPFAKRLQHRIRTQKPRGRIDSHRRTIGNQANRLGSCLDFGHDSDPLRIAISN